MCETSNSLLYRELLEGSYEECDELGLVEYLEDEIEREENKDVQSRY